MLKPVTFLGSSLDHLRAFPPLPVVGSGVREIRIRDDSGAFRVIYVASFPEAIYVLNVFQKKSQKAPVAELNLARRRFGDLTRNRR